MADLSKLSSRASYPSARSYVLKLHRDARPDLLAGRIENVSSGRHFDFADAAELVAGLERDIAAESLLLPLINHGVTE